jgi:hypothetical protein
MRLWEVISSSESRTHRIEAMADENPIERSLRPRGPSCRARTLVVRWWRRSDDPGDQVVRGMLRDIAGTPLGAFNDFSDLVELLRRETHRDG